MRSILIAIALTAALGHIASAQDFPYEGVRLRITTAPPLAEVRVGEFWRMTGDTLHMTTAGRTWQVRTPEIARVERGTKVRSRRGTVSGAIIGAAGGAAVGCYTNRDLEGAYCGGDDVDLVVLTAAIGAAIGAWIGGIVLGHEEWTTMDHTSPFFRP